MRKKYQLYLSSYKGKQCKEHFLKDNLSKNIQNQGLPSDPTKISVNFHKC